ncbi:FecR family protein [Spirosoma validum]|uniref:FecR domain-containing protein n=1 Tax=Spirosoma validum TaxID=2771355 RepID=A0A927GCR8_9BACT|nr:FecR family protein [Spirosoma validum]MBD2753037.1 FecR domain-containing protein [Spirosoma validum]
MDYRTYTADDFLLDESFRQWTTGTSPTATEFWEQWLIQNSDRVDVVRQAQELVRALDEYYRDKATDDRIASELQQLMERAVERRDAEPSTPVVSLFQRLSWGRWAAAAVLVITVGVGVWQYVNVGHKAQSPSYAQLTKSAPIPLQEKINTSHEDATILLGDGSLVTLRPKSRLSYPRKFTGATRTVYLNGEAFFDVVKNPAQPFLIYASQMVTKVLGTSFLVRAFESEKSITVTVRTGRVSVYKQQDFETAQRSGSRRIQGVILTPNQQITLNLEDNRLMKALVEKPVALTPSSAIQEQNFDDAPVARVFSAIEHTYGVKIHYNEKDLSACLVNLTFRNESMLEQLDVVCQTIGATYEVLDGQVVITSKGCQ